MIAERDRCKNKSREEVQKAVLDLLKSEGVPSEIIVKDAIARDQALDSFEAVVREKMQSANGGMQKEDCWRSKSRIKDLQEESAGLWKSNEGGRGKMARMEKA